jgi:hypothetical protein
MGAAMTDPAHTGPPAPPPRHDIDPISERLGAITADVRALRDLIPTLATKAELQASIHGLRAELRVWSSIILALVLVLAAAVFRLAERLPAAPS